MNIEKHLKSPDKMFSWDFSVENPDGVLHSKEVELELILPGL